MNKFLFAPPPPGIRVEACNAISFELSKSLLFRIDDLFDRSGSNQLHTNRAGFG